MVKSLICFDMDNTLIHSDKAHVHAFRMALKEVNVKLPKVSNLVKLFGKPKPEVVKNILGKENKHLIDKVIKLHDKYLYGESSKKVTKVKGLIGTLKKLKKDYHLAVLSNCKHKNICLLLKAANIDPKFFDVIVGYDEVTHSKPYPDEIIKARNKLNVSVSYMVGDSIYDIRSGKKARVKTVGVLTGHYSRKILKEEKPDMILRSVVELPKKI